jgi:hypothetical protein
MLKTTVNSHPHIQSRFRTFWTISFVLFLAVGLAMLLIPEIRVGNLLEIEFAPNMEALKNQITDPQKLESNTMVDFLFILAYTCLFYCSGRIIYDLLQFKTHKLLFLLFLPGVFDILENILLLQMLHAPQINCFTFCKFYYAVRLKWLFVVPGAITVLLVLLYYLYAALDRIFDKPKKT